MTKMIRILSVLLAAVCTVAALALATVNHLIYNDRFIPEIADQQYVEYLHRYIAKQLKADAEYYGIEPDYLIDSIDDEEIKKVSDSYYLRVYHILNRGEETGVVDFSDRKFKEGIYAFSKKVEDSGAEFDQGAVSAIAQETALIARNCCISINDKYLTAVSKVTGNRALKSVVSCYWLFAVAAAVFAALCVVIPKSDRLSKSTLALSSVFIPSLTVTVLMGLFYSYDFKSKLVLADTPMKQFLDRMIDGLFSYSLTLAGVISAVTGIAFLVLMILRIRKENKKTTL